MRSAVLLEPFEKRINDLVDGLEGGQFIKGVSYLTTAVFNPATGLYEEHDCCLGVGCKLAMADPLCIAGGDRLGRDAETIDDHYIYSFPGTIDETGDVTSTVLPAPLLDYYGFSSADALFETADLPDELRDRVWAALEAEDSTSSLASVNDHTTTYDLVIEILKARPASLFIDRDHVIGAFLHDDSGESSATIDKPTKESNLKQYQIEVNGPAIGDNGKTYSFLVHWHAEDNLDDRGQFNVVVVRQEFDGVTPINRRNVFEVSAEQPAGQRVPDEVLELAEIHPEIAKYHHKPEPVLPDEPVADTPPAAAEPLPVEPRLGMPLVTKGGKPKPSGVVLSHSRVRAVTTTKKVSNGKAKPKAAKKTLKKPAKKPAKKPTKPKAKPKKTIRANRR